ncbi:hypothetical protein CR513_62119, partial [Mucuna pruriens]
MSLVLVTIARRGIKSQVFPDFIVVLTPLEERKSKDIRSLYINDASRMKGNKTCVLLEGPNDIELEHSLHFVFKESNN